MTPKDGVSARALLILPQRGSSTIFIVNLLPTSTIISTQNNLHKLDSTSNRGTAHIMATSMPSRHEIVTAYRHLYKGLLRAVQYSRPARFDARNQLRDAFRREDPSTFNKERIDKTVEFLGLAAQEAGLEHRILKNLLRMNYERREQYRL